MLPLRTIVVVIGGFRQRFAGSHNNGMLKLWHRLRRFGSPSTALLWVPWNHNFAELAEAIHFLSPQDVIVIGYSWGAGRGLLELARHLGRLGRRIDAAVLSDPVFYSRWLLGRWAAVVYWLYTPKITVPANVRRVWHFFQRRDRPCGHPVVAEDEEATTIYAPVEVQEPHERMDSAPAFWQRCERVLTDLTEQRP